MSLDSLEWFSSGHDRLSDCGGFDRITFSNLEQSTFYSIAILIGRNKCGILGAGRAFDWCNVNCSVGCVNIPGDKLKKFILIVGILIILVISSHDIVYAQEETPTPTPSPTERIAGICPVNTPMSTPLSIDYLMRCPQCGITSTPSDYSFNIIDFQVSTFEINTLAVTTSTITPGGPTLTPSATPTMTPTPTLTPTSHPQGYKLEHLGSKFWGQQQPGGEHPTFYYGSAYYTPGFRGFVINPGLHSLPGQLYKLSWDNSNFTTYSSASAANLIIFWGVDADDRAAALNQHNLLAGWEDSYANWWPDNQKIPPDYPGEYLKIRNRGDSIYNARAEIYALYYDTGLVPTPTPVIGDCSEWDYLEDNPLVDGLAFVVTQGDCIIIVPDFEASLPEINILGLVVFPGFDLDIEGISFCPSYVTFSDLRIADMEIPADVMLIPAVLFVVMLLMRL